jgi:hypothetical protein
VAVGHNGSGARRYDPADDVDECRLAGAIGAEECEDFAPVDLKIDALQSLKTGAG